MNRLFSLLAIASIKSSIVKKALIENRLSCSLLLTELSTDELESGFPITNGPLDYSFTTKFSIEFTTETLVSAKALTWETL